MAELELFYWGIMFGSLPALALFLAFFTPIKNGLLARIYGSRACVVKIIRKNRRTETKMGKIRDNAEVWFDKKAHPFDPEQVGLEGRSASIIFHEDGNQVKLTEVGTVYPLTAKQYNSGIMDAIMAGADNIIVKKLSDMRLFLIGALLLSGAAAYFAWQLAEKLI